MTSLRDFETDKDWNYVVRRDSDWVDDWFIDVFYCSSAPSVQERRMLQITCASYHNWTDATRWLSRTLASEGEDLLLLLSETTKENVA